MINHVYTLTDDEAACAAVVARRRNRFNAGQTNLPGGESASESDRLLQHYMAAMAEIAVSRVTNLCWTGCGRGSDGVPDVGRALEVRSVSRRGLGLLARRKDRDDLPCVLVLVEPKAQCTILGWETYGEVKRRGRGRDLDSERPCWTLPADKLRPIESMFLESTNCTKCGVERGKGAIVHACFNCNKILCWRCYWRHEPECYERRGGISGKEGSD